MPEYKIVDAGKLDADLKVFADAIRAKLGTQASLRFPDGMATAISQISSSASSANVAWGSVIPTQDYYADDDYLVVNHNLGVEPNFYIFLHNGEDTLPSDATRGAIVVDVGYIYVVGEIYYESKNGIRFYDGTRSGYEDERNSQNFIVYAISSAGRRIVAGEEYIWICGVMG